MAYVIDEESSETEDYIRKFEFFGLALAKAIFDEIPLNLCMSRLMFKLFLNPNADISLDDIEHYDSSVHSSLKYILDNEIDDDEVMEFL